MFSITADAAAAIRELAEEQTMPESGGMRLSAEQEGDEISIEIELAEEPSPGDQVVEEHGARVFLDADSAELLADVELGVESHGDHVHFQFVERGGANGADPDA